MEINPRYSLWELLGAKAGVDLAYLAYRHQRGEEVTPEYTYADDARLMYFKQDFRGYWDGYRKIGEWSFAGYIASLLRPSIYRVFDLKDLRPFYHSSLDFIKRNILKLFGINHRNILSHNSQEMMNFNPEHITS